jgi:hypothetical protein
MVWLAVAKGSTRAERRHAAMMARGEAQPVTLSAGEKRAAGEIRVDRWDRTQRLFRAAKSWGAFWGLALASILVPVAHFILVPGFLIAGPIAGVSRYRQKSGVLGGEAICPSCGARLVIEGREDAWPFLVYCGTCKETAWVDRKDSTTPATGATSDR